MKKELVLALVIAIALGGLAIAIKPNNNGDGNPGSTWQDGEEELITDGQPVGTSDKNAPSCNSVNCCDEECNAEGVCLEPAVKQCETPTDLATCECEEYDEITGECIACAPQCCFACDGTCVGDAI
jgi:hypothetical protein